MHRVLPMLILVVCLALVGVGPAAQGNGLIDMEFDGARLSDVLRVLGEFGEYNVIVDPDVQGNVTFRLHGMGIDEALDMVVRTSGYSYRRIGNTIIVGNEVTLRQRFDTVESKLLGVKHVDPAAIVPVLRLLLPNIEVQADVAQRALVVRGTPADIARAERLVRERDVRPLVNLEFVQTPVGEILGSLARLGQYNFVAQSDLGGPMTVVLRDQTVEAAIALVARRAGLVYEIDGMDLYVGVPVIAAPDVPGEREEEDGGAGAMEQPSLSAPKPVPARERRIIRLAHVGPAKIVEPVRVLAGEGGVWADEGTRTLIVSATGEELEQIEDLVATMDVPTVAVRGVLHQGGRHVAIVQIDDGNYIVRSGDEVGGVVVVAVDADGISVETVHGHRLRVGTGGK